eukprot:m.194798 g.194798  ORF g.194798 m.194798 type:complete len:755 (-) comp17625_c0_seq1:1748-4012(-)
MRAEVRGLVIACRLLLTRRVSTACGLKRHGIARELGAATSNFRIGSASASNPTMARVVYPAARREDGLHEGDKVEDPYRWLEDPDSEETRAFVTAQNDISHPLLATPIRDKFAKRHTELYNYPKYGCPFKRGERYFYFYNTGLQNHSVLYVQDSLDGEARVFLDPNTLSEDGTVSLRTVAFSEDGRLMAYGLSKSGSDWMSLKVRDVEKNADLSDDLQWVKFSCLSWTHDNKGFFYNCYDQPKTAGVDAGTETDMNVHQKLYYHVVGDSQDKDILCYDVPEHPKWMIGAEVTNDGKYVLLSLSEGCDPVNRLFYAPLGPITGRLDVIKVVDNFDAQYEYISNEGTVFTFKTNLKAPKYRIIRADLAAQELNWQSLLPEAADVLEWAAVINHSDLVVAYLRDVKSILELRRLDTAELITNFPIDIGYVEGFSGRHKDTLMFYKFVSFLTPGSIYYCDLSKGKDGLQPKTFRTTEIAGIDTSTFETKQVFYKSKDGTRVPMFILHKKGLKLDGSNAAFLYGYGGFNISLTPSFSASRLLFVHHFNGVYAVANLRGGGEYGEEWHKAGTKANKQNVFDDFQAAAQFLIDEKYTQSSKLAINGGSNGGLLVAACINQRPDLFGCAVAAVGVMDMLRFHKFTIGHAWITDYGCADEEEDFKFLIKYSPLHNVRVQESQYPSTLLMTGDHDDRVVPLHSLKLIATLQYVLGADPKQTNKLLVRVETKAGHGAGKPTSKIIEETADMFGFIASSLGLQWTD